MSLLTDVKALRTREVAAYVGVFLATVAPGFLTIFYFAPALIERYDAVKLILLSLSLTLPVVVINITMSTMWLEEFKNPFGPLVVALGATFLAFYLALAAAYAIRLRFVAYLGTIGVLELVLLLIFVVDRRHDKEEKKGRGAT